MDEHISAVSVNFRVYGQKISVIKRIPEHVVFAAILHYGNNLKNYLVNRNRKYNEHGETISCFNIYPRDDLCYIEFGETGTTINFDVARFCYHIVANRMKFFAKSPFVQYVSAELKCKIFRRLWMKTPENGCDYAIPVALFLEYDFSDTQTVTYFTHCGDECRWISLTNQTNLTFAEVVCKGICNREIAEILDAYKNRGKTYLKYFIQKIIYRRLKREIFFVGKISYTTKRLFNCVYKTTNDYVRIAAVALRHTLHNNNIWHKMDYCKIFAQTFLVGRLNTAENVETAKNAAIPILPKSIVNKIFEYCDIMRK